MKIENREEAALEDLSIMSKYRKSIKHFKNQHFSLSSVVPRTPSFLRRKLPSGASSTSTRRSGLADDEKKKLFLPRKQ